MPETKIGVTGHQERNGVDWDWVRSRIKNILSGECNFEGYSSLAVGTDQVFAEAVLESGGQLIAVIPTSNYTSHFKNEALKRYTRLLTAATKISLNSSQQDEVAFLDAGKWIARECDYIVAVWDGEAAEGVGGTGDIVDYTISLNKPIYHINPITKYVCKI